MINNMRQGRRSGSILSVTGHHLYVHDNAAKGHKTLRMG